MKFWKDSLISIFFYLICIHFNVDGKENAPSKVSIQLLNPTLPYESKESWRFQLSSAIKEMNVLSMEYVHEKETIKYTQKVQKETSNLYTLPIDKKALTKAGMIKISLETIDENNSRSSSSVYAKLTISVPWKDLDVSVLKHDNMKVFSKLPKGEHLSATRDDMITIKIQWPFQNIPLPKQCMIELTPKDQSKVSLVWALEKVSKEKTLTLMLSLAQNGKKFQYYSGEYEMKIYMSHNAYENSLSWSLGNIALTLDKRPLPRIEPLYTKTLLHESDTTLHALPEIIHKMHTPEKQPLAIIPYCFSGLVVLLTLGWLKMIAANGWLSFPYWPKNCTGLCTHLLFLTSFKSIFILFFFYWIHLTIYETLYYLLILGTILMFTGRKAFKDLIARK